MKDSALFYGTDSPARPLIGWRSPIGPGLSASETRDLSLRQRRSRVSLTGSTRATGYYNPQSRRCAPVAGFGSGVRIADIWDIILINR